MVFQYLESTLHTVVVAMLDKPQTSFQVVRNNLPYNGMQKLVNLSIGKYFSPYSPNDWLNDQNLICGF